MKVLRQKFVFPLNVAYYYVYVYKFPNKMKNIKIPHCRNFSKIKY